MYKRLLNRITCEINSSPEDDFREAAFRIVFPRGISLVLLAVFLSCGSLACSGAANSNAANPVSDYDHEFNEPEKKTTRVLAGPSDLSVEYITLIEAQNAYEKGLYSLARQQFEKLQKENPSSYYSPLVELKLADIYFWLEDYEKAIAAYDEFIHLRPQHEAAPYIFMQLGNAHRLQYSGPENEQAPLKRAIERYRRLLAKYPESEYALSARVQIADCREKLARHEAVVASFYYKQEQWKASAYRYQDLLRDYADTRVAESVRQELPALLAQAPAEFDLGKGTRRSAAESPSDTPSSSLQASSVLDIGPTRVARAAPPTQIKKVADVGQAFYAGNVSCERLDEFDVIEVAFSAPFLASVANERLYPGMTTYRSSNRTLSVSLARAKDSSGTSSGSQQVLRGPTSCDLGTISASLQLKDETVELQLSRSAAGSLTLLQLDRPQRFVVIQKRTTSRAKM